jgi:predicted ATPase
VVDGTARPTLIVVSGPPGSGKTTLAPSHLIRPGPPCNEELMVGAAMVVMAEVKQVHDFRGQDDAEDQPCRRGQPDASSAG